MEKIDATELKEAAGALRHTEIAHDASKPALEPGEWLWGHRIRAIGGRGNQELRVAGTSHRLCVLLPCAAQDPTSGGRVEFESMRSFYSESRERGERWIAKQIGARDEAPGRARRSPLAAGARCVALR